MQNLILIGFMGSGKSTLGKRLARKLGWQFVDTDKLIEQRTGRVVASIFAIEGEAYFRRLEHEILLEMKGWTHTVIATGGGLPCAPGNLELLSEVGLTVYLKLSPEALAVRLSRSGEQRPLLTGLKGEELLDAIRKKLTEREVVYLKADLILSGKLLHLEEAFQQVKSLLESE